MSWRSKIEAGRDVKIASDVHEGVGSKWDHKRERREAGGDRGHLEKSRKRTAKSIKYIKNSQSNN